MHESWDAGVRCAHLSGDLHVHDLEYFGTRGFCQDWDLRYFFYYVYKGAVYDGEQVSLRTYGEFEREVRFAFKALMNVMRNGDYWGKPFNFPKPEIAIEPQLIEEDEEFNTKNPDLPTYGELYDLAFEQLKKESVNIANFLRTGEQSGNNWEEQIENLFPDNYI